MYFWFLTWGSSVFAFEVHVNIPSQGGFVNNTLLLKSHQKSLSNTHWQYFQKNLKLPLIWPEGKKLFLLFTAYRGLSYTSEIAFDDIHMRPGLCPTRPLDATAPPRTPSTAPTPTVWSKTIPISPDPMKTREFQPFYDTSTYATCEIRSPSNSTYAGKVIMEKYVPSTHVCCGNR